MDFGSGSARKCLSLTKEGLQSCVEFAMLLLQQKTHSKGGDTMIGKKGGRGIQRTTIPEVYRKEMGRRIRSVAMEETKRRSEEARKIQVARHPNLASLLAEINQTYGIPARLIEQYISGERTPSIQDLRVLAHAMNTTMEYLMQDVPYLKPSSK
jgi:transcriptional regulator with XRE-family HTH domain